MLTSPKGDISIHVIISWEDVLFISGSSVFLQTHFWWFFFWRVHLHLSPKWLWLIQMFLLQTWHADFCDEVAAKFSFWCLFHVGPVSAQWSSALSLLCQLKLPAVPLQCFFSFFFFFGLVILAIRGVLWSESFPGLQDHDFHSSPQHPFFNDISITRLKCCRSLLLHIGIN